MNAALTSNCISSIIQTLRKCINPIGLACCMNAALASCLLARAPFRHLDDEGQSTLKHYVVLTGLMVINNGPDAACMWRPEWVPGWVDRIVQSTCSIMAEAILATHKCAQPCCGGGALVVRL